MAGRNGARQRLLTRLPADDRFNEFKFDGWRHVNRGPNLFADQYGAVITKRQARHVFQELGLSVEIASLVLLLMLVTPWLGLHC